MTEEKNELQTVLDTIIFNNDEFNNIRGVSIDGKPWFVGKDICGQFGDTNHKRSLSRIDSSDKMMIKIQTAGGKQTMTVINESGLYALLFMMQPAKAKGCHKMTPLLKKESRSFIGSNAGLHLRYCHRSVRQVDIFQSKKMMMI